MQDMMLKTEFDLFVEPNFVCTLFALDVDVQGSDRLRGHKMICVLCLEETLPPISKRGTKLNEPPKYYIVAIMPSIVPYISTLAEKNLMGVWKRVGFGAARDEGNGVGEDEME